MRSDGKRLYVAENGSHALAIVNVAEGKVIQTIPLPDEPTGVCIRSDGKSASRLLHRDFPNRPLLERIMQ